MGTAITTISSPSVMYELVPKPMHPHSAHIEPRLEPLDRRARSRAATDHRDRTNLGGVLVAEPSAPALVPRRPFVELG